MINRLHLLTAMLFLPTASTGVLAKDFSKTFSPIKVAKQNNDIRSPWQKRKIHYEQHMATCIRYQGKKSLLVTSFAISNHTEIFMQPYFQSKKIPLEPIFVDHEVNLAILKAKKDDDLSQMIPVKIGNDIKIGSKTSLFTDQNNIKLNSHSATLSAVDIFEASTSSYQMIHFLFKAQQKALGWSEPILQNNKLVAMASGQNSDYIYAIPARVIKHFIDEQSSSYRGFPSLGFLTQSLISPTLREALGAPGHELGVRVAKVFANSPFINQIRKNDVLVEINGYKINSRQAIEHPTWGEIPYVVAINELYANATVKLKLWRGNKEFEINKPLKRYLSNEKLVRQHNYNSSEPHLIFAGLIFQELSIDYLKTWGVNWQKEAKSNLLYHWIYKNDFSSDMKKRIIMMSKVLADRENHGYTHLSHQIVDKVNGIPISSFIELEKAFNKPIIKNGKEYAKIEFSKGKGEVVLSYKELEKTHQRIAKSYGIGSSVSFFNRAPTKS